MFMRIFALSCVFLAGIVLEFTMYGIADDSPHLGLDRSAPEDIGLRSSSLKNIDAAVEAAMRAREIPGAVILVARHGRIGYLKAFGERSVRPVPETMTVDTIFDLASFPLSSLTMMM